MVGIAGRAARHPFDGVTRILALLFISVAAGAGCREQSVSPGTTQPISLSMNFSLGDAYTYQVWALDEFGYPIPDSTNQESWRVVGTNGSLRGFSGVVSIRDSVNPLEIDTLYYAFSPRGDIYQYGLVSYLLKKFEGRILAPQWDSLAAFSLGIDNYWVLTGGDSSSDEKIYGVVTGETDYFTVTVNRVQTVFSAYRVQLTKSDMNVSIWVTDSPSAFATFQEEPTTGTVGLLRILVSLTTARR